MIEIREAQAGDLADWMALWQGYCEFYGADIAPDITLSTWARILDPMNALTARMALIGGNMVGLAHHHTHLSTWDRRPSCYLEDLFVAPNARGFGVARTLMDDLISLGKARNWASIYWITAEDNETARKLYDGYAGRDPFVRYCVNL